MGGKVELSTTAEVTIQGMIANGGKYDDALFYNWRTRSGKTGWHNSSRYCEKGTQYEVSLNPAQAWCVNNQTGGKVYFRISGGVSLTPVSNKIGPGYGLYGNMTPVAIDIQDMRVLQDDGKGGKMEPTTTAEITLQGMIANGGKYDDAQFYNWRTRSGKTGWHNSSRYCEKGTQYEVTLQPGQAFCLNNETGGDIWLEFKSPIAPAPAE